MAKQRRISDGYDTFTKLGISIVLVLAIFYQRVPMELRWIYVAACICAAGLGLTGIILFRVLRRQKREREWEAAAARMKAETARAREREEQARINARLEMRAAAERENEKRRKLLEDIGYTRQVRFYSPLELEAFAADLFRAMGYETQLTPVSGDHGIDVHMRNLKNEVELVQCKQWNGLVTENEVRDFAGVVWKENAVRGYFFAPGGFTSKAIEWADSGKIVLADEKQIYQLLEEALRKA